jgi:hypothetical protein
MTDIGYGPTLVFRDPDNIQLEFYVHPDAGEVAQCFTEAESPDAKRLIEATANPQTQSADRAHKDSQSSPWGGRSGASQE